MNCIIYSQYSGGDRYGMVYGSYFLAREWVKAGGNVTIVSASFSHTRHTQPNLGRGLVTIEIIDGIRHVWIKTFKHKANNLTVRLINIFIFSLMASFYGLFSRRRACSAVICSSHHPFAIFASLISSFRLRSKLIYEIRDLWPLSLIYIAGKSKKHPLYLVMRVCERFAIMKADTVVSVLDRVENYIKDIGLRTPVAYIPNGIAEDIGGESDLAPSILKKIVTDKAAGNKIIVYAGSFGYANPLDEIVNAISCVRDKPVFLYLVGSGVKQENLERKIRSMGLEQKVFFFSELNRAGVRQVLDNSDATYVGYMDSPLYQYGISPTKLNDYLLACKPVIFFADFSLGEISQCPSILHCRSAGEVADQLEKIISDPDDFLDVARAGKNWALKERSYVQLAQKFSKLVEYEGYSYRS